MRVRVNYTNSPLDGEDPLGSVHPKFVLDDFTDSLYASNSTIAAGETCEENVINLLKRMEYVDPRGNVNICKTFYV